MNRHVEVWAMLATPFSGGGAEIDHESLARYAREVTARGCGAVIVLGVIGEPATLSADEKMAVARTSVETAGVPVWAGLMSPAAADRHADARLLADALGDTLAGYLVPVGSPDPATLRAELEELHATVARPLLVQDYPASSGVQITVSGLAAAIEGLTFIAGIKCEAPPTFARIRELSSRLPDVRLMSGMGGLSLIDDLSQGATLVASGISRPEVIVAATAAWARGDVLEARRLVDTIGSFITFEIQQHTSIGIRKEHWRRQGVLASADVRPPTVGYAHYLDEISRQYGL